MDLAIQYLITKNTVLHIGSSFYIPGDLTKTIYSIDKGDQMIVREDPGFWSYVMIRFAF